MKVKGFIIVLTLFSSVAYGQIGETAFHFNWTTIVPTYTGFVSNTSSQGMRIGFTKFVNERFGFGIEGGYTVLNDYVPRQTYEFPGGAFTTDIYNYMYYYTLAANGQYYFKTSGLFVPYASLAFGAGITEYAIFYNVYSDSDNKTGLLIRPELGAMYRFSAYSGMGLKAAVGMDYATNKSDYFDLKNFSGISFQVGIVLFNN